MRTTWRCTKVTSTEGQTVAELVQVSWFKRNPEYDQLVDEVDVEMPDEFLDAEPGEPGADYIDAVDGTKPLTLDITDGLDLTPGDNVVVTIDALDRVPT